MITDLCGKPPLTRSKLLKKTKKIYASKPGLNLAVTEKSLINAK